MDDLQNTKRMVERILATDEKARNSDDYLFIRICTAINSEFPELPFGYAMKHREEYGIPAFETVRRTRQKAQADNPELKASDKVKNYRKENEEAYRTFATFG